MSFIVSCCHKMPASQPTNQPLHYQQKQQQQQQIRYFHHAETSIIPAVIAIYTVDMASIHLHNFQVSTFKSERTAQAYDFFVLLLLQNRISIWLIHFGFFVSSHYLRPHSSFIVNYCDLNMFVYWICIYIFCIWNRMLHFRYRYFLPSKKVERIRDRQNIHTNVCIFV